MAAAAKVSTHSLVLRRRAASSTNTHCPTQPSQIVTATEYLPLRLSLLEKEKQLTRSHDAVNAQRRALPSVEVSTRYTFGSLDSSGGVHEQTLLDLFAGRPQLIVYHFMFDPAWDAGCASCSLAADHFPTLTHLHSHSTSFVAVSRAPPAQIAAYQQRMGWTGFPWVSSHGTSFNHDFHATQDPSVRPVDYNFKTQAELEARGQLVFTRGEQPGYSVFILGGARTGLGEEGRVYHTYSTYARGGEHVITTLSLLDLTPLGRQDGVSGLGGLGYKRHDEYTEDDLKGLPVNRVAPSA